MSVERDADYRGTLREPLGVFDFETAVWIESDPEQAGDDARAAERLLRSAAERLGIGWNDDGAPRARHSAQADLYRSRLHVVAPPGLARCVAHEDHHCVRY